MEVAYQNGTRCIKYWHTCNADPCLVFPEKDWQLFLNRIWKDLNDCGEEPLYVGEWDGVAPNIWYRVVKVQGSRFFIICHIHNHTGYNQ